ncbi:MAG: hypothetical protein KVP17_000291 [Porospora cf. gigantea B]|uniref:uncharacterized protein n=1 Tax=Porospora cf. gigantea B TaxID=2853592 RepID=UPI003571ED73|nr:MAG: hypothetical protein KVP17_000291 [Porospora cf. gigantea B]
MRTHLGDYCCRCLQHENCDIACRYRYKLDAFNLKSDLADGHFTADGGFEWRKKERETDSWVASLADNDIATVRQPPLTEEEDGVELSLAEVIGQLVALLPNDATTPAAFMRSLKEGNST